MKSKNLIGFSLALPSFNRSFGRVAASARRGLGASAALAIMVLTAAVVAVPLPPAFSAGIASFKNTAVAWMPDGSTQVVAIGADGGVYHRVRYVDGTWQDWASVGVSGQDVSIAAMPDGSAQVAVIGPGINGNGYVYHGIRFEDGTWTPFNKPGGASGKRIGITGLPDGSAQLVIVGTDERIHHTLRRPDGSWTPWGWVGIAGQDVSIAGMTDGSAQVAAIGPGINGNGYVYHAIRRPDGTWTPFGKPGGSGKRIAITGLPDGSAQLVIVNTVARIDHILRRPDGSWTPWGWVGITGQDVSIAGASGGEAHVAVIADDGAFRHAVRYAAGHWSPLATPGPVPVVDDIVSERPVTPRTSVSSVAMALAPRVRLHPWENYWPLSGHTFINHSSLRWAHDYGCPDQELSPSPSKASMASGLYRRQEKSNSFCMFEGTNWQSNQSVSAHEDGGPSGGEGMFLDLANDYRDGQGFQGGEPVYYDLTSGSMIQYWFHYGHSETAGLVHHEGDWERIAIRLDQFDRPQEVQYFIHHGSCTLPWSDVPKVNGRPIVWSALEAHGSYPQGADPNFGDVTSGDGPLWDAQNNLDNIRAMPWYGYGGGWGEVGNTGNTTGPDGPPHKGNPGFASALCDMS